MLRLLRTLLALIILALACSVTYGQTFIWQGSATQFTGQFGGLGSNKWFLLPNDTLKFTNTSLRKDGQMAYKLGTVYVYDSAGCGCYKALATATGAVYTAGYGLDVTSNQFSADSLLLFKQNRNSYSDTAHLGTNDAFPLEIGLNGIGQWLYKDSALIGIGNSYIRTNGGAILDLQGTTAANAGDTGTGTQIRFLRGRVIYPTAQLLGVISIGGTMRSHVTNGSNVNYIDMTPVDRPLAGDNAIHGFMDMRPVMDNTIGNTNAWYGIRLRPTVTNVSSAWTSFELGGTDVGTAFSQTGTNAVNSIIGRTGFGEAGGAAQVSINGSNWTDILQLKHNTDSRVAKLRFLAKSIGTASGALLFENTSLVPSGGQQRETRAAFAFKNLNSDSAGTEIALYDQHDNPMAVFGVDVSGRYSVQTTRSDNGTGDIRAHAMAMAGTIGGISQGWLLETDDTNKIFYKFPAGVHSPAFRFDHLDGTFWFGDTTRQQGIGIGLNSTLPVSLKTANSYSSGGFDILVRNQTTPFEIQKITSVPNSALTNSSITVAAGTSGTDVAISGSPVSLGGTVTINIPTASASNRGVLSTSDWTTFNSKVGGSGSTNAIPVFTASGTIGSSSGLTEVSSVFGVAERMTQTVGTLTSGQKAFAATTTMPNAPSGAAVAYEYTVTGNGSAAQNNRAFNVIYSAGYTGSAKSIAGEFDQLNTSTGNDLQWTTFGTNPTGNSGLNVATIGTTTGLNVGGYYEAYDGNLNVGLFGKSTHAKNSATNIGVIGQANNTGSSPIHIGGLFTLGVTAPTYVSGALIADNGATTDPIFRAKDNGTDILTISDGGLLGTSNVEPITDNTYYIGENSATTPHAYKGVILKDTTNGNYYRIEVVNGVITATAL